MSPIHALQSINSRNHSNSPRTALAMSPIFRSTAAKILGGLGLSALSFWLTLQAMEYFQSPWEPIRPPVILTFGDALASAISLTKDTKFQFPGNGYVELQNTKGLQCLKFKCNFSLTVAFGPIKTAPQFVIGQSSPDEAGWHLLWSEGRLVMQTDGGAVELAAAFSPKPGQRYKLDIATDEQGFKLSVDDAVVARSKSAPFTDLARDVTIGGRAGPNQQAFTGAITEVRIARRRPGQ